MLDTNRKKEKKERNDFECRKKERKRERKKDIVI